MGDVTLMNKPTFTVDQLIPASQAAKNFGGLRKKAKEKPIAITDNGDVDTIVVGYEYFEQMYARLMQLEQLEEERTLTERVARLDKDPTLAIPWRSIRKN